MTTTLIDMTYEEWEAKYKPITDSDGNPRMFETYGDDYDEVLDVENEYLWTWTDGGDYSIISNGFSYVNRMGYYICTVPSDTDNIIQIDIYEMTLCDMGEHVWVDHERYDGTPVIICSECEMDKEDNE
jgi:hypothetical protein